jgi:hypothetical protein
MQQEALALSVDVLVQSHEGEWLALEVIDRDDQGIPKTAKLLTTSSSRLDLVSRIGHLPNIYIKFAGPVMPSQYGFLYRGLFLGSPSH